MYDMVSVIMPVCVLYDTVSMRGPEYSSADMSVAVCVGMSGTRGMSTRSSANALIIKGLRGVNNFR